MYKAPPILFNRHLETIYPALLRKVKLHRAARERIATPDDDFLDIDWYRRSAEACVIISHGLEGNSQRAYVKGMARAFFEHGVDVAAWNFRGCSGEVNRQLRFYHSGATDDLETVVNHVARSYSEIYLVGFSLGGNLTLKYLGERPHASIKKAVAFSVPLDLYSSCLEISKPSNWIYSRRFLKALKAKVSAKAALRPDLPTQGLASVRGLLEFDDAFTGPIHGFRDAIDYYTRCSSIHFIQHINIPTLVVNARNDPFLSNPECFPIEKFKGHPAVKFEFPDYGGHVGFALFGEKGLYWSEKRALAFILDR